MVPVFNPYSSYYGDFNDKQYRRPLTTTQEAAYRYAQPDESRKMQMGAATMATPSPSSANERTSGMPNYSEEEVANMTPEERLMASFSCWNKQAEEAKKRQEISLAFQLRGEREEREQLRQRYWREKEKEREKTKDSGQAPNGATPNGVSSASGNARAISQSGESRKRRHEGDDQYGREEFRQGFAEMNRGNRNQQPPMPHDHARWVAYQQMQHHQAQQAQQMQHQQYQQSMMMQQQQASQQQQQRSSAMQSSMNGHAMTMMNPQMNGSNGPMMMMMNNSPLMQPSTSSPHTIQSSSNGTQCSPCVENQVATPPTAPVKNDELSNLNADHINLDVAVAQMTGSAMADLGNDDLFGDLMPGANASQASHPLPSEAATSVAPNTFNMKPEISGPPSQGPTSQHQQGSISSMPPQTSASAQPPQPQAQPQQPPISMASSCNYGNPPITPTNGCTSSGMPFSRNSIGAPLCTSTPVSSSMAMAQSQGSSQAQQSSQSQVPPQQRVHEQGNAPHPGGPRHPYPGQNGMMPPPYMPMQQGYPVYQENMQMPGPSMMQQSHGGMPQYMIMRMQQQRSMQQQLMAQQMQHRQNPYFGMHPMNRADPRFMNPMMDPSLMGGTPRMPPGIGMPVQMNQPITSPSYPQFSNGQPPMYQQYPMN